MNNIGKSTAREIKIKEFFYFLLLFFPKSKKNLFIFVLFPETIWRTRQIKQYLLAGQKQIM